MNEESHDHKFLVCRQGQHQLCMVAYFDDRDGQRVRCTCDCHRPALAVAVEKDAIALIRATPEPVRPQKSAEELTEIALRAVATRRQRLAIQNEPEEMA